MNYIRVTMMLLLVSCRSGIIVHTDYDRDINIKSYSSYSWAEELFSDKNQLYYNELSSKRIKTAVNSALSKKGYLFDMSKAELIIHYHIIIENKSELRTDPYGVYGPYWMRPQVNSYQYTEGTLIIDIIEAKSKSLAWRGWATSIIDADGDLTEELIINAVNEIFNKYPFKAPK